MKIYEVRERTPRLVADLLDIWEVFVRATHHFLSDAEITQIKEYVPQALQGVVHLIIAEDETDGPTAFIGIENNRLEMLFPFSESTRERSGETAASICSPGLWSP